MTTPNMSSITSSLERSLQNFSLNNDHHPENSNCSSSNSNSNSNDGGNAGAGEISSSDLIENHQHGVTTSQTAYELNSHIRMPYHWEQCLDLKTGELYYINWRTGMKSTEDPRTTSPSSNLNVGFNHSSSVKLDDESSYESEGSTTEESSCSPSTSEHKKESTTENNKNTRENSENSTKEDNVLVVAGCKSCFMYFMVVKQVEDCPKCTGQLIHFASP